MPAADPRWCALIVVVLFLLPAGCIGPDEFGDWGWQWEWPKVSLWDNDDDDDEAGVPRKRELSEYQKKVIARRKMHGKEARPEVLWPESVLPAPAVRDWNSFE